MSETPATFGVDRNGTPLTLSDLAESVARAANALARSLIEFDDDPSACGELAEALGTAEHALDKALGVLDEDLPPVPLILVPDEATIERLAQVAYETWHGWWRAREVERGTRMADDTKPWSWYREDDGIRLAEIEVARAVVAALVAPPKPEESEISIHIIGSHLIPAETLDALGRMAKLVYEQYKAGWRPGQQGDEER